jgi:hypothetical protein
MKKIILTTLLSILGTIISTSVFAATTVSFSPVNINVVEGQNFNVSVSIDPQEIKNYAEKLVLNYPADLLAVNSFTFNDTWIPLAQPGYNLIDNTSGVLIKSAGYPGGFSSKTNFGIISFSAKKTGSGDIMIGKDSTTFRINEQSALTGNNVPLVISKTTNTVTIPITQANVTTDLEEIGESITDTQVNNPLSQTAAVSYGADDISGFGNIWLWILIVVIAIIIILGVSIFVRK